MKATYMFGAGDVRTVEVTDPTITDSTDAIIRVARACVCGSDLWPFADMEPSDEGQAMGHEALGVVEEVGTDVRTLKPGELVVMPMFTTDGSCEFCREGYLTGCRQISFFGRAGFAGAQSEALRIPFADANLVAVDTAEDDALLPSLLTLSDVMSTGHHAAVISEVGPGKSVAVIGDGAVGLCGVIAAKRLGAEQITVLGHHKGRTDLARELGATDIVEEHGEEAIAKVMSLSSTGGAHSVLECVGTEEAVGTAVAIARPGGAIGRVGVPHYRGVAAFPSWVKNLTVRGGPTPVRTYIEELLPDVLDGTIQPGRVFDQTVDLDAVPGAYQTMADRDALKVLIRP
jgi:threonine dehydrogenase-like Zn-dependent dehydrogenase